MEKTYYDANPKESGDIDKFAHPVLDESDPEDETDSELDIVVCDCEQLNVRKEPSVDSEILTVIPVGTKLMTEDQPVGEWINICVEVDGEAITGFVMTKFLRGI